MKILTTLSDATSSGGREQVLNKKTMGECFFTIPFYYFSLGVRRKRKRLSKKQEALLRSFKMDYHKTYRLSLLCQILAMIGVVVKNTRTIANHSVLPLAVAIYTIGSYTKKAANGAFYKFDDEYG